MIARSTIDQVKSLDIVSVIGHWVELKKKGATWECLSPFTEEKTPSFKVNQRKQTFTDYSSGKWGDGISFVMQIEHVGFLEAVKMICDREGIPVEYENLTPEEQEKRKQEYEDRKSAAQALDWARIYYKTFDLPGVFEKSRQFKQETLKEFEIGFAPEHPTMIKDAAKDGFNTDLLINADLARERAYQSDSGSATTIIGETFRNRIMFPIYDTAGRVVAYTGRALMWKKGDKYPKYLNSNDTVWNKGKHLYGLYQALDAIKKERFAYLTEGNTDVMRMHEKGLQNTVAACGTALTDDHCKLLHRFTDQVVVVPDADEPGMAAMHKNARLLISHGFSVSVLIPGTQKSKKAYDPDEWLLKLRTPDEIKKWTQGTSDYICDYLLIIAMARGEAGPKAKADAIKDMETVIESVPDDVYRGSIYDAIVSDWPVLKKHYKPSQRKTAEKSEIDKLTRDLRNEFFKNEFWEEDGGYWTYDVRKKFRICAFTFEILFFVQHEKVPKYVCRFTSAFGRKRLAAISAEDFASVSTFKKAIARLHGYVFEGTDTHFNKIKIKNFLAVPEARELTVLGWYEEGNFWVWANGIYMDGQFVKTDRYGIVTIKDPILSMDALDKVPPESQLSIENDLCPINTIEEFKKEYGEDKLAQMMEQKRVYLLRFYYLPYATSSSVLKGDERGYELQKRFCLVRARKKEDKWTFKRWSKVFLEVYGENGKILILFYLAALYRDLIFKYNNNYFPMLNFFGERQSGKSKAAESLSRMFGEPPEDGINLESGSTATGLNRYMSMARNVLTWLNEYKNNISKRVLAAIKSIADGSGKTTGMNTGGNEVQQFKPVSAAMICGQDLPTQDPAIFSRQIVTRWNSKGRNEEAYRNLKTAEQTGVFTEVTCELLDYRPLIHKYAKVEPEISRQVREEAYKRYGREINDRTGLNIATLLAVFRILLDDSDLEFPFTYKDAIDVLMDSVRFTLEVQDSSDDVEAYFGVLQSIVGKAILENTHYKIVTEGGKEKLYLRVGAVHNEYRAAAIRQGLTPYDIGTMRNYLKNHRSFLGNPGHVHFKNLQHKNSAYVFDYGILRNQDIVFMASDMEVSENGHGNDSKSVVRDLMEQQQVDRWLESIPIRKKLSEGLDRPIDITEFESLVDQYNEDENSKYEVCTNDAELTQVILKLKKGTSGNKGDDIPF